MDDRYQTASTMMVSQRSVDQWYAVIGNNTLADVTLERLIHKVCVFHEREHYFQFNVNTFRLILESVFTTLGSVFIFAGIRTCADTAAIDISSHSPGERPGVRPCYGKSVSVQTPEHWPEHCFTLRTEALHLTNLLHTLSQHTV